jgi:homoserine kinase
LSDALAVSAPASSANLGPGFDCLALALDIRNRVVISAAAGAAMQVTVAGEGAGEAPAGLDNLFLRAFVAAGGDPAGLSFDMRNEVPFARGLGSSAATIVAGLVAADAWNDRPPRDLLGLATELEGHPDNVAAALRGGFVVCTTEGVARFEPPAGLEAVLVVPHEPVRTRQARAALPAQVPLADAAANAGHAALLVLGLTTGDWDMVGAGLRDTLHQPYRAHLYPRSADLMTRAPDFGALGATISGAGPTVLVWTHYEQTGGVVEALRREAEGWAAVIRAPFEPQGADVREL